MDVHEIFSIGPQWAKRYEVTRNLTQPHLPSFVMTYHDLATQLNQIFISQPNLDWSGGVREGEGTIRTIRLLGQRPTKTALRRSYNEGPIVGKQI